MKNFLFGTKAETLELLKNQIQGDFFLTQFYFSYKEWKAKKKEILSNLQKKFSNIKSLAIRSSSTSEDTFNKSNAGVFYSAINIKNTKQEILSEIKKVFKSYDNISDNDQVLIQPMIQDVEISGVVFSFDISTGAPYISINYDDVTGQTDTVTSGKSSKLVFFKRDSLDSVRSSRFKKLLKLIYLIEESVNNKALDIEFCITDDEKIYILQVRPIAVKNSFTSADAKIFSKTINKIKFKIDKLILNSKDIAGTKSILGDMPDWNPAEIIGTKPSFLATSLYKKLIMDSAWSVSRSKMGYKRVRQPLMYSLGIHPFIDVRASLNSFLPKIISKSISNKIINQQINFLSKNKIFHDKVEFKVAITCWDLNLYNRKKIFANTLTNNELDYFISSIKKHTTHILTNKSISPKKLMLKSKNLNESNIKNINELKSEINNVIKYGIVPFSILARHAFIAVAILKSLNEKNYISKLEYDNFLTKIETVSSEFVRDKYLLDKKIIKRSVFLKKYGHLRPGTYDINVKRYDENSKYYLSSKNSKNLSQNLGKINMNKFSKKIQKAFDKNDFNINADFFLNYAKESIEGRELVKFIFTKNISEILKVITKWAYSKKITTEDVSNIDLLLLNKFINKKISLSAVKKELKQRKKLRESQKKIRLPNLILSKDDCNVIRIPFDKPTFITNKKVEGNVYKLGISSSANRIKDKIIIIESADPGYDWIFSHKIKALITKYGGANSHMAIRCAEFSIPAAIGCGERIYDQINEQSKIYLDCMNEKIDIL